MIGDTPQKLGSPAPAHAGLGDYRDFLMQNSFHVNMIIRKTALPVALPLETSKRAIVPAQPGRGTVEAESGRLSGEHVVRPVKNVSSALTISVLPHNL